MPDLSTNTTVTASELIRATALDGALMPRVVGRAERIPGPSWAAVLIEDGRATFEAPGTQTPLRGPVAAWRPWPADGRLVIEPGAVGAYVLVGSTPLANAVGYKPESRELRELADRIVTLDLAGAEMRTGLTECFTAILQEVRDVRAASRTVIEAYLRILLIRLWRSADRVAGRGEHPSPAQRIYNRFGSLVELHFRDRWTVGQYARALAVSRDRLGDICSRIRGVPPKAIIDRRVGLEARLLLQNSSNSIEQISGLLGFSSPAQFSRFFHRVAGQPPGAFRNTQDSRPQDGSPSGRARPYEWP